MKRLMLINGLITLAGFLLDVYGIYDLSFYPALIGLILGIIDCITFWMREELKEKIIQWRKNLKRRS